MHVCGQSAPLLLTTLEWAGCTTVLSEGIGDGGITVRNPFAGDRLPTEVDRFLS